MPTHSIEVPGQPGEPWVTTEVAALWCGVSDSTFLRLIGRKKGGESLPGVSEWMRQHPHSKKVLWHAFEVAMVAYILRQRGGPSPGGDEGDDDADEKI